MERNNKTIAVIGAGSWGTALALLLARNGHQVLLWDHLPEAIEEMQQDGCNRRYLPDYSFPQNLIPSNDFAKIIQSAELILLTVPSHAFKVVLKQARDITPSLPPIVWGCKGLDPDSQQLLHVVAQEILGKVFPMAVLSGPSFAKEVAMGLPTAVCIASKTPSFAQELSRIFSNSFFRIYTTTDMIGVQLGGAIKNIIAIATGISDGMGFGANARSALMTRGLAEMMRLGLALGGKQETFMGLTGLGDLILTCTDDQSRNRRFGLAIGKGSSSEAAIEKIGQVVEGAKAAKQVYSLAQKYHIEMPIVEQVYNVLYQNISPKEAVNVLFARPQKAE